MGLLPDTQKLRVMQVPGMSETFSPPPTSKKPLVIDPGMNHDKGVTHVPWCMSGSLPRGGGENVPGIPVACTTRSLAHLVRGPCEPEFAWGLLWLYVWRWLRSEVMYLIRYPISITWPKCRFTVPNVILPTWHCLVPLLTHIALH